MTQNGPHITLLLISSGVITVIPLLLFAVATKNTDFITLGFIQYLNPTIQLLMAVFVLHEAFSWHKAVVFAFIWFGILVFIFGSLRSYRKLQQMRPAPQDRKTADEQQPYSKKVVEKV
jgi:chloramphenicol-sensitive protein RarD